MHSIFHDRTRPRSKWGSREVQLRKMGLKPDANGHRNGGSTSSSSSVTDFSGNQTAPGEAGVAAVAEDLFERVTQYHAQIGANVGQEQLRALERSLVKEANALLGAREWEEALNAFTHALAVCEKAHAAGLRRESQTIETWAKAKLISEKQQVQAQATIVLNIGYCLHCLGELEAAKEYYTQAGRSLSKARRSNAFIDWWRYGEETESKLQMIKLRLDDISEGNRPYDHANEDRELPYWKGSSSCRYGAASAPGRTAAATATLTGESEQRDYEEPYTETRPWRAGTDAEETEEEEQAVPAAATEAEAAEAEAARKEWLQYHMQMGEWDQAAELVLTAEEREDLEYLIGRAEREANV